MKKILRNIFTCSILVLLLFGCTKHNAPIVKQTYNDITGRFNGYFNADEIYTLAIKNIENNRFENYDTIIPINGYGTLNDTKGAGGDLDIVIEKTELTVQTSQTKKKNKNFKKDDDNTITNWGDDALLLMAKAYYMKGEYENSLKCLKYITAYFPDGVDARTRKKIYKQRGSSNSRSEQRELAQKQKSGIDIRPSKSLFVHEPAKSEALVWMIKNHTAMGNYNKAQAILTHAKSDMGFVQELDRELNIASAEFYLQQGKINQAIQHLKDAESKTKNKRTKSRYQFVLAQLYETVGQNTNAAKYYDESRKGNPNFDMTFYAKFNLVKMARKGGYNKKEGLELLSKLIRDNKNKEFLDQLYYQRALFALDDRKREDCKDYLKKSVQSSIGNDVQKANSYILLADLYYEEEDYVPSQANYDSSLMLIDVSHKKYEIVYNRSTVLTDLVVHLNTINLNDSLLLLASIPQKERENMLYKLAVDIVEKEEKEKQASLIDRSVPETSGKKGKGTWYFYSSSAISAGLKKFQQKWGERPLEDNWRRSEKSGGDFDGGEEEVAADDFFGRVDALYEEMLASIPETEEEKEALNKEIITAYFASGDIYKNNLDNEPKATQTYETLSKKYKDNKYEPEVFYNLYLMLKSSNKTKSDYYKNELLNNHPDSKFAQIILDPLYFEKQKQQEKAVIAYYEKTYEMYADTLYQDVIDRAIDAKDLFPDNHYQAKFDLLKALAIGKLEGRNEYLKSLTFVVDTYRNTEEEEKATEILAFLRDEVEEIEDYEIPDKLKNKINNVKGRIDTKEKVDGEMDEKEDKKGGVKLKFGEKEFQIGGKDED